KPDHVFDRPGTLPSTFFRIVWPLRAINIWRRREGHTGSVRAAALLASHVAGDTERAPTASVKAGVKRNEFVFASVEAGQLHGAFDGFSAAVAEKCHGQAARCNVGKLLGEVRNRLHMINV